MTPESRKAFNTYVGVLLIILSLVCFGLTAYMVVMPNEAKDLPPPKFAPVAKQPCLEGLTALGFNAVSTGSDIRVSDSNPSTGPQEKLRNASLGISMCHYYMKSFCMGSSCSQPGLTFVLTPDEPK